MSYANSKGLREKLKGNRIEISLDQVPLRFSVRDEGWMVFLLLWYVGKEKIYINPEAENLVVSYTIKNGDTEVRKGSVTIPNYDKPISQKMFQATRKMTWNYLAQYDSNIQLMARQFVDDLIKELEK